MGILETELWFEDDSSLKDLQTDRWVSSPVFDTTVSLQTDRWASEPVCDTTVTLRTDLWGFNPVDNTGSIRARPMYFR